MSSIDNTVQKLRDLLANAPKVHPKGPYEVRIEDRKTGKYLWTNYVMACGTEGAKITAMIQEVDIYGRTKTVAGTAKLRMPVELIGTWNGHNHVYADGRIA